jgi:hypothetical protein
MILFLILPIEIHWLEMWIEDTFGL